MQKVAGRSAYHTEGECKEGGGVTVEASAGQAVNLDLIYASRCVQKAPLGADWASAACHCPKPPPAAPVRPEKLGTLRQVVATLVREARRGRPDVALKVIEAAGDMLRGSESKSTSRRDDSTDWFALFLHALMRGDAPLLRGDTLHEAVPPPPPGAACRQVLSPTSDDPRAEQGLYLATREEGGGASEGEKCTVAFEDGDPKNTGIPTAVIVDLEAATAGPLELTGEAKRVVLGRLIERLLDKCHETLADGVRGRVAEAIGQVGRGSDGRDFALIVDTIGQKVDLDWWADGAPLGHARPAGAVSVDAAYVERTLRCCCCCGYHSTCHDRLTPLRYARFRVVATALHKSLTRKAAHDPYKASAVTIFGRELKECGQACLGSQAGRCVQHGLACDLEVFRTTRTGLGVRCKADLPKNSWVCEYTGEVISKHEQGEREPEYERQGLHVYSLPLGFHDCVVDATKCGSIAR